MRLRKCVPNLKIMSSKQKKKYNKVRPFEIKFKTNKGIKEMQSFNNSKL